MTDEIKQKIEKLLNLYKYIAIDIDGIVYAYSEKPKAISESGFWCSREKCVIKSICNVGENPYADWQESLCEIKDSKLIKVEGEEE